MLNKGNKVEPQSYQAEIESWRHRMESSLRAERGWLALAGLFWLEEGHNYFGASPDNDIVLPTGAAPDHAGSFEFHGGETTLSVADVAAVTVNGGPVASIPLRSDATGHPSYVAIGDLTMLVIQRGGRYGIRLWDRRNPMREAFTGRRWYPIRESYRVTATFVPYDPPKTLPFPNILGDTEMKPLPGYAVFTLAGREYRLDATTESDELFFIFHDLTAGDSTYPAGRFLKAALPLGGQATLDFNKAYSPPCAFTAFATCPLPPPQNHLALHIEAGELYDHGMS
jgi:uncharacterized protein (DUF1684 family)